MQKGVRIILQPLLLCTLIGIILTFSSLGLWKGMLSSSLTVSNPDFRNSVLSGSLTVSNSVMAPKIRKTKIRKLFQGDHAENHNSQEETNTAMTRRQRRIKEDLRLQNVENTTTTPHQRRIRGDIPLQSEMTPYASTSVIREPETAANISAYTSTSNTREPDNTPSYENSIGQAFYQRNRCGAILFSYFSNTLSNFKHAHNVFLLFSMNRRNLNVLRYWRYELCLY